LFHTKEQTKLNGGEEADKVLEKRVGQEVAGEWAKTWGEGRAFFLKRQGTIDLHHSCNVGNEAVSSTQKGGKKFVTASDYSNREERGKSVRVKSAENGSGAGSKNGKNDSGPSGRRRNFNRENKNGEKGRMQSIKAFRQGRPA